MDNFRNYLESKRIIPKKQVHFYEAWILQFFKFVNKQPTDKITPKEVESFLKHLSKRKEEWQVNQAEEAI